MLLLAMSLAAVLTSSCLGSNVGGRTTYINYNSQCGVWNEAGPRRGLQFEECCPVDVSFPGTPWQQLTLSYSHGGTFNQFLGNTGVSNCPLYTVQSERVLDDGTGLVGIEHVMKMGLVTLTKTETWDFRGKTLKILFRVKYDADPDDKRTCLPIEKLRVMHAVDPDQDLQPFSTFNTVNDVIFNGLYAEATGPRSCTSFGYGICANKLKDGSEDVVGFTRWVPTTGGEFRDPNGELRDDTVHYQHTEARPMYCGDEREFFTFAVLGRCFDEGRENFKAAHRQYCRHCYPTVFKDPGPARCTGECPCRGLVPNNCTCTYKCNTRAYPTPDDTTKLADEYSAEVETCRGGRRKRQAVEDNLVDFEASPAACALAESESEAAGKHRRR